MKFLVHGSIAYDLLLATDASFLDAINAKSLDKLSVSFFAPHYKRHHGGTGANIAWNVRFLGAEPMLVGTVGDDGGAYLGLLRERGIKTDFVEQLKGHVTATAIIGTDNGSRQIAFFHPGADSFGKHPDLSDERDDIDYAIVSPRDAAFMLTATKECTKHKIPYLFDPGQQSHVFEKDEFKAAIESSAGMVANEYEWSLASKKLGMKEKDVVNACGLLIITLGEKGIRLITKKEDVTLKAAKPDRLVNPTGAGDAARAGLLFGLASKWPLEKIGRLAAIMGSFVVEQEGTLLDRLEKDDIQERAEENYGERLPF